MFVSPKTLREYCFDFLRLSLECAVTSSPASPALPLSAALVEELLQTLSEHHLTDDVLLQPLFASTPLSRVCIEDASLLTTRSLRSLRSHALKELRVSRLSKCTINELIGCLGDQSLQRLRLLDVSRSAFTSANQFCVVIGLAKLRSLRALDVSHTDFNAHGLEIVVDDLPLIQSLNISATRVKDISALRRYGNRLRALALYNLKCDDQWMTTIRELPQLALLDVSDDTDNPLDALSSRKHDFLRPLLDTEFARLQSLDISGRGDTFDARSLARFLQRRKLDFLGVMATQLAFDDALLACADMAVAGSASEAQILLALHRYEARANFVQKSLFHLYALTHAFSDAKPDVIAAIVRPMRRHLAVISVQMAATACLYNLTKNDHGDRLHPHVLRAVVETTLLAMAAHPNNQQLQKNALLTLCSDRVLQDVTFDRFHCTQLVLDSLVAFKDAAMNRMSVAIVSILAAKISTAETSVLGARPHYMEALLAIVRTRVADGGHNDLMLKFTLSALWNLTDESPKTCQMFLSKRGMDLYLRVLNTFPGECAVETKVLGLVNNIAEVRELRHNLLDVHFLRVLQQLMRSPQIDVSYFAAGIFAHLSSDGQQLQELPDVLNELVSHSQVIELPLITCLPKVEVVLSWQTPDIEMVAYRSFVPFLPLLQCAQCPAVQLWAIWAIHHVCSKNPKRYVEMLVAEKGAQTIHAIWEQSAEAEESALSQY
ncbi:unnamed protein product [Medioppia subpectinata]|uniref:Uncharacterized protein n=1 Tax=Medioppia subpectinata TaxID=1979941 RepID=A0A7R9PVW5_9ACAR|nr:unnamed protein product [Medioppia subpectinata]CAG2103128.1 unnamed protein product [Medioppia subpectinata]